MFLMFEDESSDESDDSNDAIWIVICAVKSQDLYSTSSSSHQSSSG